MSGTAAAGQAAVRLEDLAPGTRVGGVLPDRAVTVVQRMARDPGPDADLP